MNLYFYGKQHSDGDWMLMVANHSTAFCYMKHPDCEAVYEKQCRLEDRVLKRGIESIIDVYKTAKLLNIYKIKTIGGM